MNLRVFLSSMKNKTHNFIDLFSGAGGMSLGFENAGFKCVGSIDVFEAACKTHELNFPDSVTVHQDITKVSPEEFHKLINYKDVNIIIGGPPCPTFSTIGHAKIQSLGKNVYDDKRNKLFIEYLKYVEYFQPEFFVIENVPNFMTKYNGEIFNSARNLIESLDGNYKVIEPVNILNAANYGVPQNRKRMILVGCKSNYNFSYPEVTHSDVIPEDFQIKNTLKPIVNLYDAISDLPNITDDWHVDEVEYSRNTRLSDYQKLMRTRSNKSVRNNRCRLTNERAKKVFVHMEQGSKYMDLKPEIRQILPFREDIFFDRLKRLNYKKPSWTVIAHIGMDGYMYIHPTETRTLSVREAARIQSFPDNFIFVGNMQNSYVQVGNAVPPILAEAVAKSIMKSLSI
jgi:DNA (cytosine-5)-methyltransferase 1